MESESEVILSLDPNGNFIIKIVIDNRRSRWVISFAISTVAARWPIPGDGMKTSSVCFITNQRLLQREKNIGCVEGFVVGWHILVADRVINDLSIVLAGEELTSWLCGSVYFLLLVVFVWFMVGLYWSSRQQWIVSRFLYKTNN